VPGRALPGRSARITHAAAWQAGGLGEAAAVLTDRRLVILCAAVVLFHLANAAQLPLMASEATAQAGSYASMVIAACIVLPQFIVAGIAPTVGRCAEQWGRRPVLAACFLAVPVRAALLSVVQAPVPLVLVQALDGISAAGFGVLVPLVVADLTRGTNRFNLCLGVIGLTAAVGGTVSTALGGWVADLYGTGPALQVLSACGCLAVAAVAFALPETKAIRDRPLEPAALAPRPRGG